MNRSYRTLSLLTLACAVVLAPRAHAAEPPAAAPGIFNGGAGNANVTQGMPQFSVPIVLPGGRGVTPPFALGYAAGGLGDAGFGWTLNLPAIERMPVSGPPGYADPQLGQELRARTEPDDVVCTDWAPVPHQQGSSTGRTECVRETVTPGGAGIDRMSFGGEPLIPICSLAAPSRCPAGETMPSWASQAGGWHYFRLQHDTYTRFFWHPLGRTWRVLDKNGNTWEYGEPLVATGIAAGAIDLDGDKPFRWLLARHYDAARDRTSVPVNIAAYRWTTSNHRAQLSEIFYTPAAGGVNNQQSYAHHVVLGYDDAFAGPYPARPIPFAVPPRTAPVWRAQRSRRLTSIYAASMPDGGGVRHVVRSYDFSYEMRGLAPKPYLKAIRMRGACKEAIENSDGRPVQTTPCPAMPAITFDYADGTLAAPPSWTKATAAKEIRPTAMTVLDVTGDGVADVVSWLPAPLEDGSRQDLFVGKLGATPSFRTDSILAPNRILGRQMVNKWQTATHYDAWSPFGNASAFLITRPFRSTCDEDGTCPLVETDPILGVERTPDLWVWRQIGAYTHDRVAFGKFDQLGDVDGDGLSDRRYVWPVTTANGCAASVFFPSRDADGGTASPTGRSVCSSKPDIDDSRRIMRRSLLADMNADGLADLVVLWGKRTPQWPLSSVSYFPGDGSGAFGPERVLRVDAGYFPTWDDYLDDASLLSAADVNGDGYADLIVKRRRVIGTRPCTGCPIRGASPDRVFALWMNLGGDRFRNETLLGYPQDFGDTEGGADIGDFDGNGTPDLGVVGSDGVSFVEMRPSQPETLLVEVHNGFGHTTHFSYESTSVLDAQASPPWTTHAPSPTYVVTSRTEVTEGPGATSRKVQTDYAYRDPAWNGFAHGLRGFKRVRTTQPGDARDPTSVVETQYSFSPCHQLPFLAGTDCKLADDEQDVEDGWPMASTTMDAEGHVLATTLSKPSPARSLPGMDNRHARAAYVAQVDTWIGEPDAGETESRTEVVRSPSTVTCSPSQACERQPPSTSVTVTLPPKNGRIHLRTRQVQDVVTGNVVASYDDGRVGDEGGPKDETIATTTTWEQVSPESGWLFRAKTRTLHAFAARPELPAMYDRAFRFEHDAFGRVKNAFATVAGTRSLARFHEDANRAIAPLPSNRVADGEIQTAHYEYDDFGNPTRTTIPTTGGCAETTYEPRYADHAVLSKVYTAGACAGASIDTRVVEYDRRFGMGTKSLEANGAQSAVALDAFGRVEKTYAPDPELGTPIAASETSYELTGSGLRVKSTTHPSEHETRVGYSYFDAAGGPALLLVQGNKAGEWIASGLPDRSAKGAPYTAYEPWLYTGKPEEHPLTRPAGTRRAMMRRDAFGRTLETVAVDGSMTVYTPHPLSLETVDAENLLGGSRTGGSHASFQDGHGRTERVEERTTDDVRITRLAHLATGETTRIERSHKGGSDVVVRWMQHDSLGRIVLNAEPNTTKDFTSVPSDAAAVAKMKAWRYAYDPAGRLVGTSDARGCGKNLLYDVVGNLVAEDDSPCRREHEPYTAPERDGRGALTGNGTELFEQFDAHGNLAASRDRGAYTKYDYDVRLRATAVHRRIAKPAAVTPARLDERYAPWTFHATSEFDLAGRTVRQSSGADVDALLADDPAGHRRSDLVPTYGHRGNVTRLGSSYGTLMKSTALDTDGFVRSVVYGDTGDHDLVETEATFTPDELGHVKTFTLSHPSPWAASAPGMTRQSTLASGTFSRDAVGNVTKVTDGRTPSEWPAGAQPVTRSFTYDDWYRLTDVTYSYPSAAGDDQRRPVAPSALPGSALRKRVQTQHFEYDWLGNTSASTADAAGAAAPNTGFFERGLATIQNGDAAGGHPNQLRMAGPTLTQPKARDVLSATYDDTGNLTRLFVTRASCTDAGGLCSHVFVYDWDEVGTLARARRWDRKDPTAFDNGAFVDTTPTVDLRYAYSLAGRVRKSATVAGEERHTIDVFGSLRLERARWNHDASGDYERTALTEHVYLGGLAHVTVFDKDVDGDASGRRHVLLTLGDELGSASVVVDKKTGELVERKTYQAYGAVDSDYRPERWGAHEEAFGFNGKEEDDDVGLTYFGARYYHAQLGRWLSADPLTVHAAGADLNPYAFVRGAPSVRTDPTGLADECGTCPVTAAPPTISPPPGPPVIPVPGTPTPTPTPDPPRDPGTRGNLPGYIFTEVHTAPARGASWIAPSGQEGRWNPSAGPPIDAMFLGAPYAIVTHLPRWAQDAFVAYALPMVPFLGTAMAAHDVMDPTLGTGMRVLAVVQVGASVVPFLGPGLKALAAGSKGLVGMARATAFVVILESTQEAAVLAKGGKELGVLVREAESVAPKLAGACFEAGTPVLACDGTEQPIETLRAGDDVLAWNEATNALECRPVVRTFVREADDVVTLHWRGEDGAARDRHRVTRGHRYWIQGKGWVAAGALRVSDRAQSASGELLTFEGREEGGGEPETVYNFEVAEAHSYFVGRERALVHNQCSVARTFTSTDPLVTDLANAIEAAHPGHVVGVNVPIPNGAGGLITDADILLDNAVIQVKSGGGKGMTSQLAKTQLGTSLPVIGYGPDLGGQLIKGIGRAGGLVTRDKQFLIELVAP